MFKKQFFGKKVDQIESLILDKEDLLSSTEMQFVVTGVWKVSDVVMNGVG